MKIYKESPYHNNSHIDALKCAEAAEMKQPLGFDHSNTTSNNGENDKEEDPSFRGVLRHFAENTTCHAPPKVLNHKYVVVKLFWLCCFLGGIGVFCYYFTSLITAYLKYETTTGTELKFSVLDFPAVTFCNQNQFHKQKLPESLLSLTDAFLNEKRQDMFGGEDNFKSFQEGGGPVSSEESQAGTEAPDNQQAATQAPADQQVATQAPADQQAATQAPADQQAATQAPADQQAATQAPADQQAATQAPADQQAATQAPADKQPASTQTPENVEPTQGFISSAPTTGSEAGGAVGPTTLEAGSSATTPVATGSPVTTAPAGPVSPPVGHSRKKRSTYTMNDDELMTMETLEGFYVEPQIENIENLTWFSNVGNQSSDKDILLNISSVISEMNTAELMSYGHTIDEMLQECTFLGRVCGPQHFRQFYNKRYGNCYTFNHGMDGQVTKISSPGKSFGLSLILYLNQDNYISALSPEAGARMMLHRQGQIPLMEEDGFDVQPGTNNGIAIKYVEIQRVGGKYSNCITNADVSSNSLYPGNYSQKACIKTCLQENVIKECGCANPLVHIPANATACIPSEMACVETVEQALLEQDTCVDSCPVPCWESQYQFVISSSQWPSNEFMPYLAESLEERGDDFKSVLASRREGLSQNFVKVNIYFDNLNYYKYTENPAISIEDLIGALGGHLGLWIGMSLISVMELFEFIVHVFAWIGSKYKRSKRVISLTSLKSGRTTPVQKFTLD